MPRTQSIALLSEHQFEPKVINVKLCLLIDLIINSQFKTYCPFPCSFAFEKQHIAI